jgi:hypothetical protein
MVTFKDGATVLGTAPLSGGTASFTTANLAVANHPITATYEGDANFATSDSATSAYAVTPLPLAITGVTAAGKSYDGSATAALTGGTISGSVFGGETVTLIPGSGTFASPDAGTWPVTAAGYALGGAHAANYVLSGQPAIPDATITPASATIATPPTASAITDGQTLASSTLSGGAGSVPGTFAFTAPATQPPAGTAPHGVTFTPTDTTNYLSASVDVSVTVHPALTAFETWATDPARGLTAGLNDDPADDPDHDGFANLMEFVLGGEPMISSQAIRPGLSLSGGHAVFSYHRSHLSKSAVTQVVEYGGSLTAWTPLNIPAESTATVTITPGVTSDLIEVTLPPLGPGLFVRLKASE